jgi:hypothetical protein
MFTATASVQLESSAGGCIRGANWPCGLGAIATRLGTEIGADAVAVREGRPGRDCSSDGTQRAAHGRQAGQTSSLLVGHRGTPQQHRRLSDIAAGFLASA